MNILTLALATAADPAVVAVTSPGPDWSTGLLGTIAAAMKVVAVLVVLFAAVKSIKDFTAGKPGSAAKTIVGCAIAATFLWQPTLINALVGAFAGLTGAGVEEVETIVNR
jgi:hypothetical protein